MWQFITAFVKGLVGGVAEPAIESWQQKQHGKVEQQRDDLTATLDTERKISETLACDDDVRAARQRAVADLLRQHVQRPSAPDDRPKGE